VYDISQGQTRIFFPRNTGREATQMYWTLLMSWIFGTGLSFMSLKIGTVLFGLFTLPYMYLLGKEIGGARVGLFALFFAGIGYWPNVISRVGLRFPLYPLFVAPTLYYLIRGLRTRNRNDFILSGLFLGFGLHGYSPIRIMPVVVLVAIGLYLLHAQSKGVRRDAILWLVILGLASLIVFTPLPGELRTALACSCHPDLLFEPVERAGYVQLGRRRDLGSFGDTQTSIRCGFGRLVLDRGGSPSDSLHPETPLAGLVPAPVHSAFGDALDFVPGLPGGESGFESR
jgi:hypothetical protein